MTPHDLSALLRALAPLDALTTGAASAWSTERRVQTSRTVAEPGYLAALSDSGALSAARRASAVIDRAGARAARTLRWLAERETGEAADPDAMALALALAAGPTALRGRYGVLSVEAPQAAALVHALRQRRPREAAALRARLAAEVTARSTADSLAAELRAVTAALRTWGRVELARAWQAWQGAQGEREAA